ncbi:MAG: nucleotidyltransferase family protein [Pyrinomonadaceae bacterium]
MNTVTLAIENPVADEIRWGLIQRKVQETKVLRAFQLLRSEGIEPILIKGLAAAAYYPESRPRISIDIDLAVSANEFDEATSIAISAEADGLAIDLHRELRHLDTVGWNDLFSNSRLIEIDGGTYRVLRPEDHLRVLCVHWLNDGGRDRDRLWDMYYLVANRSQDFDWSRFLNVVSDRRQRWLICTLGLAHRYLGLDLSDTPIKDEALELPRWLVKSVEAEWADQTKDLPLEVTLTNPAIFFKQVRKRIHPNPIRATIEMEGSFDATARAFYIIGNIFQRIIPSIRRISQTILHRYK